MDFCFEFSFFVRHQVNLDVGSEVPPISNAGSSEHCTAVTFKVCVLKSYSSLYCNFPRYSLEDAALGTSNSLTSTSSSFSTRKSSSSSPSFVPSLFFFASLGLLFLKNLQRHQPKRPTTAQTRNMTKTMT